MIPTGGNGSLLCFLSSPRLPSTQPTVPSPPATCSRISISYIGHEYSFGAFKKCHYYHFLIGRWRKCSWVIYSRPICENEFHVKLTREHTTTLIFSRVSLAQESPRAASISRHFNPYRTKSLGLTSSRLKTCTTKYFQLRRPNFQTANRKIL
jgi:hypothetical protein